jgi:hypothetical protein
MKQLLLAIFIIVSALSCTKSVDDPVFKHIPTRTLEYTASYAGISSNFTFFLFSAKFPAFNSAQGILTSWGLTMNRKVNGTLTISNSLSVTNDSSIAIDRYTLLETGDTTIELPNQIVSSIPHSLPPNQTLDVPIHVNVDDEINSTNLKPVMGSATDILTWNFTDVVDAYKPYCTNSYILTDSITLTLTYTYIKIF